MPLLIGGALTARDMHRVRAATPVPQAAPTAALAQGRADVAEVGPEPGEVIVTSLTELPPPRAMSPAASDDRWQRFFTYALTATTQREAGRSGAKRQQSALLKAPPSIEVPTRRDCPAPQPAVIIDLDGGSAPFAPERLVSTNGEIVEGLARLREAGVIVLWISQLPASRAGEVGRALRSSGLDPQGQDQLLLVRNDEDRKQILREEANKDVCIVAIAGDERSDFDELFDYLRNPGSAVGLYPMMGSGWFLVPSLDASQVN